MVYGIVLPTLIQYWGYIPFSDTRLVWIRNIKAKVATMETKVRRKTFLGAVGGSKKRVFLSHGGSPEVSMLEWSHIM